MIILICGSRDWYAKSLIYRELEKVPKDSVVIHCGCPGADLYARLCAELLKLHYAQVLPYWSVFGKAAGPLRNKAMLKLGPDQVWAFHDNIEESKGTKDCATQAKALGIPVSVFNSKGEISKF